MFNVYHKTAPNYLCRNFSSINHQHFTRRAAYNLFLPRPLNIDLFNFSFQGARLWNNLPVDVKRADSKTIFKRSVKTWLRAQAHANENNEFLLF